MRVVERADERFALVIAPSDHERAFGYQLAQKFVAILKPAGSHPPWRAHSVSRLLGKWNDERPEFAPQKPGRMKRLEFLAFAIVKALADVDERRDRGIERPERAGDHRAEMRRGDRLRRGVAGVPLILVARVEDKTQVARRVGADQRASIHYARHVL